MVRPVCKEKFSIMTKEECFHSLHKESGLWDEVSMPLALMESAHSHLIRSSASIT